LLPKTNQQKKKLQQYTYYHDLDQLYRNRVSTLPVNVLHSIPGKVLFNLKRSRENNFNVSKYHKCFMIDHMSMQDFIHVLAEPPVLEESGESFS